MEERFKKLSKSQIIEIIRKEGKATASYSLDFYTDKIKDIDKSCGNCRLYPDCTHEICAVCPAWRGKDD